MVNAHYTAFLLARGHTHDDPVFSLIGSDRHRRRCGNLARIFTNRSVEPVEKDLGVPPPPRLSHAIRHSQLHPRFWALQGAINSKVALWGISAFQRETRPADQPRRDFRKHLAPCHKEFMTVSRQHAGFYGSTIGAVWLMVLKRVLTKERFNMVLSYNIWNRATNYILLKWL